MNQSVVAIRDIWFTFSANCLSLQTKNIDRWSRGERRGRDHGRWHGVLFSQRKLGSALSGGLKPGTTGSDEREQQQREQYTDNRYHFATSRIAS